MKKNLLVIFVIISIVGFSSGIYVGHYQIFPFEFLRDTSNSFSNSQNNFTNMQSQIYKNSAEIEHLIQIKDIDDIVTKKNQLIDYIWLSDGFPVHTPSQHIISIHDERFSDIDNLERIDSFTVEMEFGVISTSYLFLPKESNNELVIYHQGHDGNSFDQDKKIIDKLIEEQFSVLIFSMIGKGMNNEPIVDLSHLGTVRLSSHDHFKFIETNIFHPIKFFIEPVIVTLNQIESYYNFHSFNMIGKSGGGWSTVIISALDDRIKESYSIAGSFPIWMRSNPSDLGDYEQTLPEFYNIANYEELYLMSAYGKDRKLLLVYNEFDPCCFPGWLYEKSPFGIIIKNKLTNLGKGEFDVYIDREQNKHIISDLVFSKIISSMKN